MQYWWVNQNQTYKHEVGGGYMWSPKTNANSGRNQFYINMTQVEPGDIVYSFCDTYIKAIGVATRRAVTSPKPEEFGDAGQNWNSEGWLVEVDFQEIENPIKPANHMDRLKPTLPEKYSPLQANGNGNQVYLANVPEAMANVLNDLLNNQVGQILDETIIFEHNDEEVSEAEVELISRKDIPETEKLQLVKSRRGQGLFRSRVGIIEKCCRITGVSKKKYLRASHIKPWKDSSDAEKLDGNNGLMLSPHVDFLFDKGLISFGDDGAMFISTKLDKNILLSWKIDPEIKVGLFSEKQRHYLAYHRSHVFK